MMTSALSMMLAANKMSGGDNLNRSTTNQYLSEFLNSLNTSGLQLFKLQLKVWCSIILLRNIAPKVGLCNGTRLIVVKCALRVIETRILTGDKFGNLCLILRILLSPSSKDLPFHMTRSQFSGLTYAMTINKLLG
ncbi:unnamed protein product [Ilex paraguariensis]|uniref:DNA helicase Pif1-like 2B domain-containing protein n=1 Tax=Ilex paraguariensis TaxID=185542 RepID=A0ABC8TYI3_9AQUA